MLLNEMHFEQVKRDRERELAKRVRAPRHQPEVAVHSARRRPLDHRDRRPAGRRATAQAGSVPMRSHQVGGALARAPPRLHGLCRRQALRRRRQARRRVPHRRPVHLDRLYALDPRHPLSAPQGRRRGRRAPASIRDSHSGKALVNVLETYPRDELFQIDEDTLYHFALAILQLDERPRVRVLPRRDRFDRFVSVLVYRAARPLRQRRARGDRRLSRRRLSRATSAPSIRSSRKGRWCACISSSAARAARRRDPDRADARRRASPASCAPGPTRSPRRSPQAHEPRAGAARCSRAIATPSREGYREAYSPQVAVADIRVDRGAVGRTGRSASTSIAAPRSDGNGVGLKVWSHGRPIPLSERVPVLENMGFQVVDEHTYQIAAGTAGRARRLAPRHDARARRRRRASISTRSSSALEATFLVVMRGGAENDGYNALVLAAGPDVARRRADAHHLALSAADPRALFAGLYVGDAGQACRHRGRRSCELFHARFDPRLDVADGGARGTRGARSPPRSRQRCRRSRASTRTASCATSSTRCSAAVRTNFYQLDADGQPKPLIAIKFASRKLDGLPLPRPLYEIFVYSPRVEGVHLRFGKVARGGIRWSDRPQDFRTEILGLVKAQQVKNAVIVPVGAKGGFVPKLLPAGGPREAIAGRGHRHLQAVHRRRCSTSPTISATTASIPPAQRRAPRRRRSLSGGRRRQGHRDLLRHRQRDRATSTASGSATPSRPAARPATTTRRWASPRAAPGNRSSAISARWTSTSARRRSPWSASATCRATCSATACCASSTIKLVAAFDHRDIFIDPDPDPEKSFAERKRLFDLPRSSWQDYDKALISHGRRRLLAQRSRRSRCRRRRRRLLGFAKRQGRRRRR